MTIRGTESPDADDPDDAEDQRQGEAEQDQPDDHRGRCTAPAAQPAQSRAERCEILQLSVDAVGVGGTAPGEVGRLAARLVGLVVTVPPGLRVHDTSMPQYQAVSRCVRKRLRTPVSPVTMASGSARPYSHSSRSEALPCNSAPGDSAWPRRQRTLRFGPSSTIHAASASVASSRSVSPSGVASETSVEKVRNSSIESTAVGRSIANVLPAACSAS